MGIRLINQVRSHIENAERALKAEANARAEGFTNDAFFRKRDVFTVAIFLFAALSALTFLIFPPTSIGIELEKNPGNLLLFREGSLTFSDSPTIPEPPLPKIPIRLPFREAHKLNGYIRDGIWYEFRIDVPDVAFKKERTGVLVPMVWGQGKVFLNGKLIDFGFNHVPILALPQRSNLLQIRANIEGSNRTNPISATFPLVVGDIDQIRALKKKIDSRYEINFRALSIYSLAILLFGMLFIAFPRKPELFSYIVFLFFSLLNSSLVTINETNSFPAMPQVIQLSVLLFFDYATNLSVLVFSLYFLRAHPDKIRANSKSLIVTTAFLGPPLTYFLYGAFRAPHLFQVGHLVTNFSFFIAQAVFVWPRLVFSVRKNSVPAFRKTACMVVVATILVFHVINILDYFTVFTGITSLQSNGLILNIALAITVAFEVSRAEKNQKILGSMLPKEVRETLHLSEKKVSQKGFVVLVDAIGYSADRNRFDDENERSLYIEKLAQKMLKPLNDLAFKDFSILSCTGDGIYCSIRGEASEETLNSAVRFAQEVTNDDLAEGNIQFRAAIGYGFYGVSVIESGQVRKEFVAGNILNDLSRVIGNSKGQHQIRILITKNTKHLLDDSGAGVVIDKHGFEHRYVELEKIKRVA